MKTMNPLILALATVTPAHVLPQDEIAKKMIDILSLKEEEAKALNKIYDNSSIGYRYSVVNDIVVDRSQWKFWGSDYPKTVPGMSKRNEIYKQEAPLLAHQAALQAIQKSGLDPSEITHVISVSCTGVMAPGIEFRLIQSLNLNRSVNRLGINFMGCFGAFKGLQVASSFAKESPSHRVLLVCTELCSLQMQLGSDQESILANSLFSDGVAAAIIGCEARPHEHPLFSIVHQGSVALDATLDKMTWEACDYGFLMQLSAFVPALIKRHIPSLVDTLLKDKVEITECDWAIHPGGKSILQAVERALKLDENQTRAAWETLWNYGNMSSATFLFVLERLYRQKTDKKWSVGLGFGPGLSMEGILLGKMESHG